MTELTPPDERAHSRTTFVVLGAILVGLAVIPHVSVLSNALTYDDPIVVLKNPLMTAPFDLIRHFSSGFWGDDIAGVASWRPLTTLSIAWNRLISHAPLAYHAVDLILHILAVLLVFRLGRTLKLPLQWAFAGAALWAVHPVHVEAIAQVVGRADQLMTLFVLGALDLWLRDRRVSALVCLGLAMLAKEMALVFVVVFAADAIRERVEGWWRWVLACGGLAIAYLVARFQALGGFTKLPGFVENPIAHQTWPESWFSAGVVHLHALELNLMPLTLSHEYSHAVIPTVDALTPAAAAGLLLLGVLIALVAWAFFKSRRGFILVAMWVLPYLLVSHLIVALPMVLAERVFYLPTVGLCLGTGFGLSLVKRDEIRRVLAVLLALTVLAFSILSADRVDDWKDERTLYASAMRSTPSSVKVLTRRASQLAEDGEKDAAQALFQRSLDIYPDWHETWMALATYHIQAGESDRAQKALERARELGAGTVEALRIQCQLLSRFSPREAIKTCERGTREPRAGASDWVYLAIAYDKLGSTREARSSFETALKLESPPSKHTLFNFAIFLRRHNEAERAQPILRALRERFGDRADVARLLKAEHR